MQAGELSLQQAKSRARVGKGDRPAWNHWEFSVTYASLSSQLCVSGTYVRLLLEGADKVSNLRSAWMHDLSVCLLIFFEILSFGSALMHI